jgi:D-alanyl-D-alanine carboxypeptidase
MAARIFRPLHLRQTTYLTEPVLAAPYARGYMILGDQRLDVTGLSPSMSPGSGAVASTPGDVLDFYRALLSGRLLPRSTVRAMTDTRLQRPPVQLPGQEYGLGIIAFPTSCGVAWGHSGGIPGYLSYAMSSRSGDQQVLLMINHDGSTLPSAAGQQFFALLDQAYCSTQARS